MANSIIDILKESNNALLKNEAEGIEMFKGLKHDKASLDFFLSHAVVEILTSSGKDLICTSNEALVKKFAPIKESDAVSIKKPTVSPFKTSANHSVLTWDLLKNKYASIAGNRWQILNFIVIAEDNVEMLHSAIIDILSKYNKTK